MIDEMKDLVIDTMIDGDPLTTDFSLLPLNAGAWSFVRGARTQREYRDGEGDLAVCDRYTYDMVDEGRSIKCYTRSIEWYNTDGTIGLRKDVTPVLNQKKIKSINRDFRQGRVDYLEAAAEEFREAAEYMPEPYKTQYNSVADSIDVLFSHYADSILEYIARGTRSFETLVLSETSPPIIGILSIPCGPPTAQFPVGLTVKTSILYQLRGWIETEGDVPPL